MKILNERLSAVAMGAALLVAFGGASAVAAGMVTSSNIQDDTVRSRDIHDNTVRSQDVRDNSVRLSDISDGAEEALASGGPETVTSLTGDWGGTNGVSMTPDGVEAGPYADGGSSGGSVFYNGLNGKSLSEVENLVYYARYTSTGDTGGVGVPYLRIFTEDSGGGEHDAIFSPNTQQPDPDVAEGPFHEWVATSGSWRYDDDGGTGPDQSFAELQSAHGDDTITGIYITTGGSAGQDLSSLVRSWQINGTTYEFGG